MIFIGENDLETTRTLYRTAMLDAFVQTHLVMDEKQFYSHGGPFIYITDLLGEWINQPDLSSFDVTTAGVEYAMTFGDVSGLDGLPADKTFMAGNMREKTRQMRVFADALFMRLGLYEDSLDKLVDKNHYVSRVSDLYSQLSGRVFPLLSRNTNLYVEALQYMNKEILADPKKVRRLMELVEEDKDVEELISYLRPSGFTAGFKDVIFN